MKKKYSAEKHTQILIALLKFHKVKKIVASPGTTNLCLLGSLQNDSYFEIYSSVDERSAAFIACGLAAESGEPVALSCTGATASRNYIPGLTEAYYRKLPVLAITASQHLGRVQNGFSQVVDRGNQLNDIVNESIVVDCVYTQEDEWACGVAINKALIALRRNGGGPVHINHVTTYNQDFSVEELPKVKGIGFTDSVKEMPLLSKDMKIAILVGTHGKWSKKLSSVVEEFCRNYNSVVLMNHSCNYKGDYGVNLGVFAGMKQYNSPNLDADIIINIGSIARYSSGIQRKDCEMWRVCPHGDIWDSEKKLTYIFQLGEVEFFEYYVNEAKKDKIVAEHTLVKSLQDEYEKIMKLVPHVPFSNVYVAKKTIGKLPQNSVLHIAGANTARSWNFFMLPKSVECYSNDGTMGIDGQVSALIGESLATKNRLHFGVVGDLTFFYDMNSIGNRHIGNNLRLMIINNGVGAEFKIYTHPVYQWGEDGDKYMAARGHFGNRSIELLKHYAEDLGFEYLSAATKEEFLQNVERFTTPELTNKPMIFEVFTDSKDESDAIYAMNHIVSSPEARAKSIAADMIRKVAGEEGVSKMKSILKK